MKSAELAQFSKLSLFKQFTGSKYYGVNDARNSKCTSDDCTDLKIKKKIDFTWSPALTLMSKPNDALIRRNGTTTLYKWQYCGTK